MSLFYTTSNGIMINVNGYITVDVFLKYFIAKFYK
jgi:hypothetical protein